MKRRTALGAIGASIVAGTALTGTTSADEDGPRLVSLESETDAGGSGEGNEYAVEYVGEGTVEVTGSTTVPRPCYEAEVVGIEATEFGDVVRLRPVRTDDLCPDVVSRLSFHVELEYSGETNDVFLEFLEE
ncbi:hypothetical protein [Natrarchaeobius oligotrophus]|uniref:Uncharacterized protein n=1 Tax=Natrarchaeobius chitinivorans TaxID=1679083 RepID=A0A3N6PLS0_NATCH|nr:hypothetical protein [Natrarchaeobius chitinivorans]RQG99945.1 hypothetical protein EA472_12000 [Natrarchaeobius chitinivorans]